MAAHPVLIVGDGVIEIPEEVRDDPRFRKGMRLELISCGERAIFLQPEEDVAPLAVKGDWRRLRGILKSYPGRLNDELERDRLAELASDERMLRGSSETR